VVFWGKKNRQKIRIKDENKKKIPPIIHRYIDNIFFN